MNDYECLDQLTLVAIRAVGRGDIARFARRFSSTAALRRWIRNLPQRDDEGVPGDGPKVACDVPQRTRVPALDPNCVERSLLYLAVAEHMDARPVRGLATILTPAGRHTLVVENGEPVVLDPRLTRNGVEAGLWRTMSGDALTSPRNDVLSVGYRRLLDWVTRIAGEPAEETAGEDGKVRVARVRELLGQLASGSPAPAVRSVPKAAEDVGFVLDSAAKAAPLFGPAGVIGVEIAKRALGFLGLVPNKS
jgi:transposase-like protein